MKRRMTRAEARGLGVLVMWALAAIMLTGGTYLIGKRDGAVQIANIVCTEFGYTKWDVDLGDCVHTREMGG